MPSKIVIPKCGEPNCPKCGSPMFPHYEGTFTPDGWICVKCEYKDRTKQAPEIPKFSSGLIGIKGLRKAWYEQ